MAALTTIAAVGLGISAVSAGVGMYQSNEAKKDAEALANQENARIGAENKIALEKRKSLIDKQRRQIGAGSGYTTNPTGSIGIDTNEGLLG